MMFVSDCALSQAEQEGAIKRQVRQLEKDSKEAAEVLADALKVQKRVS